jgi:hypothetical protein
MGEVYRSLVTREGRWGRLSETITEKLMGRRDMALPLLHGVGPTLIPRPQRMYLRFAAPIDTTKPARVSEQKWVETVKQHTQESLEQAISDLLQIRSRDPYRELNPLAWRAATQPPSKGDSAHLSRSAPCQTQLCRRSSRRCSTRPTDPSPPSR